MFNKNIIFLIGFIICLLYFIPEFIFDLHLKFEHNLIHNTMESIGSVIAIIMSFILYYKTRYTDENYTTNFLVANAFLSMGILDVLHSILSSGNAFVYSHSAASLLGGFMFSLILFNNIKLLSSLHKKIHIILTLLITFIFSIPIFYDNWTLIPAMLDENNNFTITAIRMNILAGLLFLLGSIKPLINYRSKNEFKSFIFFILCIIFGLSELLFELSHLWHYEWWLWHVLRFFAYCIVLYYLFIDLKNTQLNLEEREKEFRNIFDNSSDAIVIHDLNGKLIEVNTVMENRLGYDKEILIGKSLEFIDSKKFESEKIKHINTLIKRGNVIFEGEHKRKNGDTIPVEIHAKIINYKNNDVVLSTIRDITKRKEEEELAIEQSKMAALGNMIGNIAHQWRQPLSVISTAASGLKLNNEYKLLDDKKINDTSNTILKNATYLSETIETFTNFLKPDKKKYEFKLYDLIKDGLIIVNDSLVNNGIELINETSNCKKDIYINTVRNELPQVIINIINNAKDILKERKINNPWIKIDLNIEDNKAILTIEDNGQGISEDIIHNIFEPYFTTKHKSQGVGLGLHICYNIVVKNLSGKIYVKNTHNGAKFFIQLPLS